MNRTTIVKIEHRVAFHEDVPSWLAQKREPWWDRSPGWTTGKRTHPDGRHSSSQCSYFGCHWLFREPLKSVEMLPRLGRMIDWFIIKMILQPEC
jgi:hypothetical protein